MKLRLAPILLSVAVTSLVLFGGWFVYNSLAMKDPVIQAIEQFPGVEEASVDIQRDQVNVELTLTKEADLAAIVAGLRRDAAGVIGGRELQLHLHDQSNEGLNAWWSQRLFEIAEAMESRRYGDIPRILEDHKLADMNITASIDEDYVYVKLVQGDYVKFILLDRMPPMLGVWSGE